MAKTVYWNEIWQRFREWSRSKAINKESKRMLLEQWSEEMTVKCLENVERHVLSTHTIKHWISYSKLKAIFYWRWPTSLDIKGLRTSVEQQKTWSKVCQLQTLIEGSRKDKRKDCQFYLKPSRLFSIQHRNLLGGIW